MRCPKCNGKGWYIGIAPPGHEVKTFCKESCVKLAKTRREQRAAQAARGPDEGT